MIRSAESCARAVSAGLRAALEELVVQRHHATTVMSKAGPSTSGASALPFRSHARPWPQSCAAAAPPSALWIPTNSMRGLSSSAPNPRSGGFGRAGGPMSLKTVIMAMMAGAGVIAGTNAYKESKMQKVMQSSQQVVGKASVGGAFELIDQDGKRFTDKDLLGEFAMLYFGFTFCPDICPDELEKAAQVVDLIEKQTHVKVQPVFISVDPERDTPPKVKEYVNEFHPRMVGLTGDMDAVKRASKQYRVYFSKTGEGNDDYLVDHSIIHYLINPAGEFVTFYAKSYTAEQMTASVIEHMADWQAGHPEYQAGNKIVKPAAEGAKPGK